MRRPSQVTMHLFRCNGPVDRSALSAAARPTTAVLWLPLLDGHDDAVGGLVGGYADREDAAAAFADLPTVPGAVEAWHGRFEATVHRGEVNWLVPEAPAPVFAPTGASIDGPRAVITTAGFDLGPDLDVARVDGFIEAVDRVFAVMASAPGNLVAHDLAVLDPAEADDITFSIWRDERSVVDAAYRPGDHRTEVDRYRTSHTADRTSFTRLLPLATVGTWGGVDPMAP